MFGGLSRGSIRSWCGHVTSHPGGQTEDCTYSSIGGAMTVVMTEVIEPLSDVDRWTRIRAVADRHVRAWRTSVGAARFVVGCDHEEDRCPAGAGVTGVGSVSGCG